MTITHFSNLFFSILKFAFFYIKMGTTSSINDKGDTVKYDKMSDETIVYDKDGRLLSKDKKYIGSRDDECGYPLRLYMEYYPSGVVKSKKVYYLGWKNLQTTTQLVLYYDTKPIVVKCMTRWDNKIYKHMEFDENRKLTYVIEKKLKYDPIESLFPSVQYSCVARHFTDGIETAVKYGYSDYARHSEYTLHKVDGPAWSYIDEDGELQKKYFIHGEEVNV
jgi:hypothetical protein